ncbi:MAG: polyphosphate polymerase domain-containing protein [Oscillospiraceae bacterium]|nr:polyphosphate polymerase domain-containing protein [Oscillospiraceae bacterium]MDD7293285.1 polyphosphate polymerase domain-containing protein [Clostridiaceae bacterium]MDY5990851.1 polyphosphate polymerase domain-containing protein [Oscillospiraceae bacterium]
MPLYQSVFERYEKKYVITGAQKEKLLSAINGRLVPDEFGESTVCNLYFDTPDYRLIRASMERPVYKEKLRLRSYGIPDENSNVFVELKKKYKGVVYKRRINMTYGEAVDFLCRRNFPRADTQVYGEIAYFMGFYRSLRPTVSIFCDRTAYFSSEDRNVRVTFDRNIRFRNQMLDLSTGSQGVKLLDSGLYVMEVKTLGSVPLWFSSALGELEIYPRAFSKYGKAYEMMFKQPLHN